MKDDVSGFNARAEELLERYAGLVYRLAFARTRRRDAADDIFQEVFLRYVAKGPDFESEEHARAWFCRVTVNCANSYWRNPFRRRTEPLEAAEHLPAPETAESGLDACLDRLFPELRVVVHLYYYEGYSTPEIAGLLGKKESAVRMRLMRVRRQLRDYLEEGGDSCV